MALYKYEHIWSWKIRRFGVPNDPPTCPTKEIFNNEHEYRIRKEFEREGHEIIIHNIDTKLGFHGWEYYYNPPKHPYVGYWELVGTTRSIFETDVPSESPIASGVVILIGKIVLAIITAISLYIGLQYFVKTHEIIRVIKDEEPEKYVCSICGMEFDSDAALTAHRIQAHPDEPKYQCPYCAASFDTIEERQKHIEEVHGKDGMGDIFLLILAIIGLIIGVTVLLAVVK